MTTKTTITLSPIKRCYTSPNLKKRRITSNRKHQASLSLNIPNMISSATTITVSYENQNLPDLLNDILIEQQRRETITNIATILRKVGDQMDEQLQTNNTTSSSSNYILGQRTITFVHCLSHVLRFFL